MTLLAVLLFPMLAVCGLAVDIGILLITKNRLQAAVDAAAISTTFDFNTVKPAQLETNARKLAATNLRESLGGIATFNEAEIDVSLVFSPSDINRRLPPREIQVAARVDALSMLLRFVPGFGPSTSVKASAIAQNVQVAMVLVLDTSGSMCQNTGQANWPLTTYLDQQASPHCEKFRGQFSAATAVAQEFNRANDRIAVVAFGHTARVLFPMTKVPEDPSEYLEFQRRLVASLGQLTAVANTGTNAYEGLRVARAQMSAAVNQDLLPNDGRHIVYSSDGAPFTAGESSAIAGCGETNAEKLRYLHAIAQADAARTDHPGLVVHSVAFGAAPFNLDRSSPRAMNWWGADPGFDPWQGYNQDTQLHNIFMARVANDQGSMRGEGGVLPRNQEFPCVPNADDLAGRREGYFFWTEQAADVRGFFLQILANIKGKITS